MIRRLVIVGGFGNTHQMLEPLAEAACETGFAQEAEVYTLPQAVKDPDTVRRACCRQALLKYSGGATVVLDASPARLVVCNGPEPRSIAGLGLGVFRHARIAERSGDLAYAQLNRNVVNEVATHPYRHLSRVWSISKFCTDRYLREAVRADIHATMVMATGDVVCRPCGDSSEPRTYHVKEYEGPHDTILCRPAEIMRDLVVISSESPRAA